MQPEAVLIDFHQHTYLQVGSRGSSLRVIPMEATQSGMTVRWLKPAQQKALGLQVLDYPLPKAVRIFQRHARLCGTSNKQVAKALHVRRRRT